MAYKQPITTNTRTKSPTPPRPYPLSHTHKRLTARGPLLAEGEEFDDWDVGGPGASLKEGWALLHAAEAAQG